MVEIEDREDLTTSCRRSLLGLAIAVIPLLLGAPIVASYVIEYQWWREMKQVPTWIDIMLYTLSPIAVVTLLTFGVLLAAHAGGMKFAGVRLAGHPQYTKLSAAGLLVIAIALAASGIDTWTVVRYFDGWNLPVEATLWRDSVFGLPLGFYLFDLPLYALLQGFVLVLAVAAGVVYWLTARGWQLRDRITELEAGGQLSIGTLGLQGALSSGFLRGVASVFLLALALRFFLGRYEMVLSDHSFMVGVDDVDQKITLPLQWMVITACVLAGFFVTLGRWRLAAWMALALVIRSAGPAAVRAVYVRPNEISLQRPFIQKRIEATRSAFGLDRRVTETEVAAKLDGRFEPARTQALLQNVRLWNWRAFRDTIPQIHALRPYYSFADADVDRYMIDGQLRQVMLTPRELDIRQVPAAQTRWINPLGRLARVASPAWPLHLPGELGCREPGSPGRSTIFGRSTIRRRGSLDHRALHRPLATSCGSHYCRACCEPLGKRRILPHGARDMHSSTKEARRGHPTGQTPPSVSPMSVQPPQPWAVKLALPGC